jgi:hypothetical protein
MKPIKNLKVLARFSPKTTDDQRFDDYWFSECDLEILQEMHPAEPGSTSLA